MKCYFQRRDAIPVLEEEVEETYCPRVSVFRGKVINLEEDDHSSEKTMVPKKGADISSGISNRFFAIENWNISFHSAGEIAILQNYS